MELKEKSPHWNKGHVLKILKTGGQHLYVYPGVIYHPFNEISATKNVDNCLLL